MDLLYLHILNVDYKYLFILKCLKYVFLLFFGSDASNARNNSKEIIIIQIIHCLSSLLRCYTVGSLITS